MKQDLDQLGGAVATRGSFSQITAGAATRIIRAKGDETSKGANGNETGPNVDDIHPQRRQPLSDR
jgi:hypothetical protein